MPNDNYRPLSKNNRGPRSRRGKALALAHIDHGLTSNKIVLPRG